jgi:hypothetical protein
LGRKGKVSGFSLEVSRFKSFWVKGCGKVNGFFYKRELSTDKKN